MFAWYIHGTPRVYEPPSSPGLSAVVKARGVAPVSTESVPDSSTVDGSPNTIKGYSEQGGHSQNTRRPVLLIKEIMTTPVRTVLPSDPIEKVSKLFSSRRVRHAPVCDGQGRLCGIASERDLLRTLMVEKPDPFLGDPPTLVKDFMKTKVLTASPDAEIRYAARVMFSEKIGALPVVDANGSVVGIITRSDILRTVMNTVPLELWS